MSATRGEVRDRNGTGTACGLRPPAMDDLREVLGVRNECRRIASGEDGWDEGALRAEWEDPHWELARDARVAIDPEGRIVGWTEVYDRGGHALLELAAGEVLPSHRGRGVGRALLSWSLRRAFEEVPRADPGAEVLARTGTDSRESYASRLLADEAFEVARHFYAMGIGLEEVPAVPEWPTGVEVRSMRRPDDDASFYAAKRESFEDHWGMADLPFEEGLARFRSWIEAQPRFDPALFRGAFAGSELAAVCFTLPRWHGDPTIGCVDILGVRRPWRRRGLGRALLRDAFGLCRERGLVAAKLGVDAEGKSRALDLYESEGMSVVQRTDVWVRVLRPGRPVGSRGGER